MNPQNEPALWAGFLGAGLLLLTSFGVPITSDQKVAIITFGGAAYALGASLFIRAHSTPNTKLQGPTT